MSEVFRSVRITPPGRVWGQGRIRPKLNSSVGQRLDMGPSSVVVDRLAQDPDQQRFTVAFNLGRVRPRPRHSQRAASCRNHGLFRSPIHNGSISGHHSIEKVA